MNKIDTSSKRYLLGMIKENPSCPYYKSLPVNEGHFSASSEINF